MLNEAKVEARVMLEEARVREYDITPTVTLAVILLREKVVGIVLQWPDRARIVWADPEFAAAVVEDAPLHGIGPPGMC